MLQDDCHSSKFSRVLIDCPLPQPSSFGTELAPVSHGLLESYPEPNSGPVNVVQCGGRQLNELPTGLGFTRSSIVERPPARGFTGSLDLRDVENGSDSVTVPEDERRA